MNNKKINVLFVGMLLSMFLGTWVGGHLEQSVRAAWTDAPKSVPALSWMRVLSGMAVCVYFYLPLLKAVDWYWARKKKA